MIIIFGPAGSGKSVQAQLLADKNNWRWLSAGELLRNTNDVELKKIMASGKLAPDEKVNELIEAGFKQASDVEKVILDGFPRHVDQAKWLLNNSPLHGHSVCAVVILDVNKDEIVKRLSLRGRADDTPEAIEKRLDIYNKQTNPVIEYFASQGIDICHIDGVGAVDQIQKRIIESLVKCNLVKP